MSLTYDAKRATILHVEDNPADVYMTKRALRGSSLSIDIVNVADGEETTEYLRKCATGDYSLPDIVLLDINLPRVNGHELLVWMRSVQALQHIPVFALSGSSSQQDRQTMLDHGARAFFTKPYTLEESSTFVKSIENFLRGLPKDQPTTRCA